MRQLYPAWKRPPVAITSAHSKTVNTDTVSHLDDDPSDTHHLVTLIIEKSL